MRKADVDSARSFCKSCEVLKDCLISALQGDERFGIWGGFTAAERERMHDQIPNLESTLSQLSAGTLHEAVVRL